MTHRELMRRIAGRRAPTGFTLVELLVSLTIAGIAVGSGYGALSTVLDTRETALASVQRNVEAASVRRTLRQWLAATRLQPESSRPLFSGVDGLTDEAADDELTFLTGGPTVLGAGSAVVRLFIDRDPETAVRGLVATVRTWLGPETRTVELVPEATGLEIRYYSVLLGGGVWHPSWISTSVLPLGIEVTIEGAPDEIPALLAYPIRVVFEGGS